MGKRGARLLEMGVLPGGGCEGRETGGLICVVGCMLIGCMLVDMPGGRGICWCWLADCIVGCCGRGWDGGENMIWGWLPSDMGAL